MAITYAAMPEDMLTRSHQAPEGPHIYRKDGYYYLLIAEGKTPLPTAVPKKLFILILRCWT